MDLTITPDALLYIVKKITGGLLESRVISKSEKYDKIDFKMICNKSQLLNIQITKCSAGYPNLKFLLTKAMKKVFKSKIFKKRDTVAVVETKSKSVRIQKVVCSRNSSLSLIDDPKIKRTERTEFSVLKRYIAIKLLLQIKETDWETFSTLLRCYIMYIEQIHKNVKFVFRKQNETECIYRNKVKMDDIILSCNVFASSCTKIFQNSQDEEFKKDLESKFDLKKRKKIRSAISSLLLAQANDNFNPLVK